jgi:DNA repair photolyase
MPVLPGITDQPGMLAALVAQVAAAGAQSLGACALRLRAASRRRYLPVVREQFPELSSRYESTYSHSAHASDSYRAGLQQYMEKLCAKHGLRTRTYRRDGEHEAGAAAEGRTEEPQEESMIPTAIVRQLTLF